MVRIAPARSSCPSLETVDLMEMSVTTRRERRERELRKRQREKRGGHPTRGGGGGGRNLLIGAGVIVLFIVALFGLRQAGILPHAPAATRVTSTGSLPPSPGFHWPQPQAPVKAGIYDQLVPFEVTTHNLEHGGIVLAYNRLSVGEGTQLQQSSHDT